MAEQLVLDFEEWRTIREAPLYEVSNLGRVRRRLPYVMPHPRNPAFTLVRPATGECLRPGMGSDGYLQVKLGQALGRKIHRLVCEAWHGPRPTPTHQVAHGDGNRTNNRPDNLRWATPLENNHDMKKHGTQTLGSDCGRSRLTQADVIKIREKLAAGDRLWPIAMQFGVTASSVWSIKHRKSWAWL